MQLMREVTWLFLTIVTLVDLSEVTIHIKNYDGDEDYNYGDDFTDNKDCNIIIGKLLPKPCITTTVLPKPSITTPKPKICRKVYHVEQSDKGNWYHGKFGCMRMGMRLVSIHDEREWNQVVGAIKKMGKPGVERYWTSGSDQEREGRFVWMTTGRPFTFNVWRQSTYEPNNQAPSENCMEITLELLWNDLHCTNVHYLGYICEEDRCD